MLDKLRSKLTYDARYKYYAKALSLKYHSQLANTSLYTSLNKNYKSGLNISEATTDNFIISTRDKINELEPGCQLCRVKLVSGSLLLPLYDFDTSFYQTNKIFIYKLKI